jgi:hypothetical protein
MLARARACFMLEREKELRMQACFMLSRVYNIEIRYLFF